MPVDHRQEFPPAPWQLSGEAVFALKLVRKELVQSLVPPNARIVCLWPGRTLAMLYVAQYRRSPVGEYGEVIVAPAIVRWQGRTGAWISHILVDSEPSVIAGRSIWALPKELASMQWQSAPRAQVRAEAPRLKVHAGIAAPRRYIRLPFVAAALSSRAGVANQFVVRGTARVGLTRATIELTAEADIRELGFAGRQRMYRCADMNITIGPPRSD